MKIIFTTSVICIALLVTTSGYSKDWPVLKKYDQEHTCKIALPVGGIGTGTVSLGGRGNLQDYAEIQTFFQKY